MKFIKLLLFSLISIVLLGCIIKRDLPDNKHYEVYSGGFSFVSSNCKELANLVKDGHMRINRNCSIDCFVHFDRELMQFYKAHQEIFYGDYCFKSRSDLELFFGFEISIRPITKEFRSLSVTILTGKSMMENGALAENPLEFIINERDSIVYNPF